MRKAFGTLLATVPGDEPRVLAALGTPDRAADAPVAVLPEQAPEQTVAGSMAAGVAGPIGTDVARAAAEALRLPGAVILVGERAAEVPGLLTEAARLASTTGARLAWVPRRAGERGAVEAGALPTLLPGGRLVADAGARDEVERVWGAAAADHAGPGRGRDRGRGAPTASCPRCVVGGVDLDDLPDPEAARAALGRVGFVVSLEIRQSSVTDLADVVLPVAAGGGEGRARSWTGRAARGRSSRPCRAPGALPDGRVLHALADEMDVDLGLPVGRGDPGRAGPGRHHPAGPPGRPAGRPAPTASRGTHRRGAGHLAAAARPRLAAGRRAAPGRHGQDAGRGRCSPRPRPGIGVVDGAKVTVRTARGAITLPARLAPTARRRGVAAGELARRRRCARRSGSAPARVVEISGGSRR